MCVYACVCVNQAIPMLIQSFSWGSRSPVWAGWTDLSARRGLSAFLRASVHVCGWSGRLSATVPTPHLSARLALCPPPSHQKAWALLPGVGLWWRQPHCWGEFSAWSSSSRTHAPHGQWATGNSICFLGPQCRSPLSRYTNNFAITMYFREK